MGGYFTKSANGVNPLNSITYWNGAFNQLNGLIDLNASSSYSQVNAIALDNSGGIYAGGYLTLNDDGTPLFNMAYWNGSTWNPLVTNGENTGLNSIVYAFAIDNANNKLYVGGDFAYSQDSSYTDINNIACWNMNNHVWSPLGAGLHGNVYALCLDQTNNILYAGGDFNNNYIYPPIFDNCIKYWNFIDSVWHDLGAGLNNTVLTIALDQYSNIYAGGIFTETNDGTVLNNIGYWNNANSTWNPLTYNGQTGLGPVSPSTSCETIAIDPNNGYVYAGGYFSTAGSITTFKNIAVWVPT